jgi:hypothetical protein
MGAQIKISQDGRNIMFWNFTFSLVPLHIPATVVDRPLSHHDERVGFQKGKGGKVATTRILAHNLVPTWYKISPFFALPTLICHCMFSVKFLPFYDDYYYHVKSWLKITLTYFC